MIEPIRQYEDTFIHGWTFENFRKYVAYEAMFYDRCERVPENVECKRDHAEAARYTLYRGTRGYNGFLIERRANIVLAHADGDVPEYDPEQDAVNMSER